MEKIFETVLLLIFMGNIINAETIEVKYKVEFGIFGEIGVANAKLIKDKNSYEIDINLQSTGIAKILSGDRKEQHISKGHMEDGVMVSDMYQITKSYSSKTIDKVYMIDHISKKVIKRYRKWKGAKLTSDTNSSVLYAKDDLLTLYFNLNSYIKDKITSQDYTFKAVGAEKQKSSVDIHIPNSKELPEFKEMLGSDSDNWYARAIIHQHIFSSERGELLLSIAKDGITQKAVLKDVIMFGDIRANRIN
jgi:hypothetical protein